MNKTIATPTTPLIRAILPGFALTILAACGGGSGSSGNAGGGGTAATYAIGGTVTGLTGSGLVLANGSDTVSPAAGATSFVFRTALTSGSSYAVTVGTQPTGARCQVVNGTGQIGSTKVTNVIVTCAPVTYTIGGSISGLTTSGLVLANGSDTVSPAAGAMSFTFATALASGSSYAVAVKTQPKKEFCQVTNGSGQLGSATVINVSVACARAWTWVSGSSTFYASGVYGTQGTAASGNVPGARSGSVSWIDGAGDLWLFGGLGYGSTGISSAGNLNDLWRYNPGSGQWTWVSGLSTPNAAGVYGTQGTAAAANVPGARAYSVSWIDGAGDLWLYGGDAFDAAGLVNSLNDLWRYSPGSGQWTWVSGSSAVNAPGVYGTQGTAAPNNVPGARAFSVSWIDGAGDLWLFGGVVQDPAGNVFSYLNDLWRYSPGSGQWTWVSGSSTFNAPGVYGTRGTAAPDNVPGARSAAISWIDGAGDLWLFGGVGLDSAGNPFKYLNDLWRYSPGSGQWTWVSGSSTFNAPGVYGTRGTAAAANVPGAHAHSVSWIDGAGDLWLYGGTAIDTAGSVNGLDDLWRYSPGSGQWTWVSGSSTPNAPVVYGTQGTADVGNSPGSRIQSVSWTDSAGDLWLFGGGGRNSAGTGGWTNDLWKY